MHGLGYQFNANDSLRNRNVKRKFLIYLTTDTDNTYCGT